MSLWVYVWWDWYQILPIHLLHTNWTIVAPLFYSLRFSVSLPAYNNLQRSCRKASCSSSRESHIIFKAVMMNIQTICLPSGSHCSLFLNHTNGYIFSGTRITIWSSIAAWAKTSGRAESKQADFSETSVFQKAIFSNHREKKKRTKNFAHIIYNLTCVWLPTSYYRYGQENCSHLYFSTAGLKFCSWGLEDAEGYSMWCRSQCV